MQSWSGPASCRSNRRRARRRSTAFADDFARRRRTRPFDHVNEFPIRATLVRRDGAFTHMVMTLSHFATDRAGGFAMYATSSSRDPVTGRLDRPVRTAAAGAGRAAAHAGGQAAERRRAGLLGGAPAVDPAGPRSGPGRRRAGGVIGGSNSSHRRWTGRSGRSRTAPGRRRDGTARACTPWRWPRVTGSNTTVIQMLVSNRFRPGLGRHRQQHQPDRAVRRRRRRDDGRRGDRPHL